MPSQVQNAIDSVLQYAIRSLGFKRKDILFYSWSIGAYPASWAAANYNECRGVVRTLNIYLYINLFITIKLL